MSEECVQNEKRDTGEDSGNTIRMGAEGIKIKDLGCSGRVGKGGPAR